jgi:hypothetical protein
LLHLGTGYLLIDPENAVHCCGQITLWHYVPVDSGTIKFSVLRKTSVNSYKVVGTNTVVIKGKGNMTIYPAMIISAVEYVMGSKISITVIIMGKKRNKLRPVKVISLVYGVDHPFQQYFSHIVEVSFIS